MLIGRLAFEADVEFDFIAMPNREVFDLYQGNGDVSAWSHQVLEGAINPHKMKLDEDYLEVAALFGKDGLNLTRVKAAYDHSS